jgi:alpha-glucan,water dikinase
LDELWRVANGEVKYADYAREHSALLAPPQRQASPRTTNGAATAAPKPKQQEVRKEERREPPAAPAVAVPEDLVGIQAYLLWEQAGKPDGADFGDKAREALRSRLASGMTLEQLEKELRGPVPKAQPQQQDQQQQPQQQAAPARAQEAVVGQSMGQKARNPLDLIRRDEGGSGATAKPSYLRTPLTALVEAAQADSHVTWHRVGAAAGACCVLHSLSSVAGLLDSCK